MFVCRLGLHFTPPRVPTISNAQQHDVYEALDPRGIYAHALLQRCKCNATPRAALERCRCNSKCQHATKRRDARRTDAGRTDAGRRTDATTRSTAAAGPGVLRPRGQRPAARPVPAAARRARRLRGRRARAARAARRSVRDGGPYFIACSDGQTRGPFGGADVVRLVAQGLAEKGAKCALGRRVATGASSSSSTKNPWKTTKLKHLRVHRWRATRFVAKTAKKGAVQTFQAAATAAPPQLYKTWADEEAEWAKEVVKQQSIVKTKKLPSGAAAAAAAAAAGRAPPRRRRHGARRRGTMSRNSTTSRRWKADGAEERRVALSKAGYRVGPWRRRGIEPPFRATLKPTDAKHS